MNNFITIMTLVLLGASSNARGSDDTSKPPFKTEDIKIELGAFAPCLSLVPDRLEYFASLGNLTVYMKQTLKKSLESCSGGRASVRAVIHDGAGNELMNMDLSLPEDVGTTNRKPLPINWLPSNLKPPVTMKLR